MKNRLLVVTGKVATLTFDKPIFDYVDGLIETTRQHEVKTRSLVGETIPLTVASAWKDKNPTRMNLLFQVLSASNRSDFAIFAKRYNPYDLRQVKGARKILKNQEFGKFNKEEADKRSDALEKFFLNDPATGETNSKLGYFGGDYWLFVSTQIKKEDRVKDYEKRLKIAFSNAVDPKKGKKSTGEMIVMLVKETGLTVEQLVELLGE